MKVGILVGKFLPLHRGHLTHIFNSYSQCDELHVIICNNEKLDFDLCKENNMKYISPDLRFRWLTTELKDFNNIKISIMNESYDIPEYPFGWKQWSECLKNHMKQFRYNESDEIIVFTGEANDILQYETLLGYRAEYFDYSMTRYPISATLIRKNPLQYWEYLCGSVRPYFAKKILITGTESTGKTTLVKMLAKMFHTSWAEEMGRTYVEQHVKDERFITDKDYLNIIRLQIEANDDALKNCNKICFFDTDIIVTYYYYTLYNNGVSHEMTMLFESIYQNYYSNMYDKKLFLSSDGVPWVDDGLRRHSSCRKELDEILLFNYNDFCRKEKNNKIVIIDSDYHNRLTKSYEICQNILNEKEMKNVSV